MTLFNADNLSAWEPLERELQQPYMRMLNDALNRRKLDGATLCPDPKDILKAFRLTPLKRVRVVIVGQDPYATPGVATGLCFSADEATGRCSPAGRSPPQRPYSLARILNRVSADIGFAPIMGRDLESWAENGVLLLNAVLTVEQCKPGSHRGLGWECFTNRAIQLLDEQADRRVVFMLWGKQAKRKAVLIDEPRHKVLREAHPRSSEFSRCEHFTEANAFLKSTDQEPVCWNIPPCPEGQCAARPGACLN